MEITHSVVGVYDSHLKAIEAIKILREANISGKNISITGKTEVVDDQPVVTSLDGIKNTPVLLGVVLGPLLGLLEGVSIITIPGLGFLYGAGAIIGIIGGFDLGLVGGGIGTILVSLGINKDKVTKYYEHLEKGRFLVIVHGNKDITDKAERLLHSFNQHIELQKH